MEARRGRPTPVLSVVIPAHNEAFELPRTLATLGDALRALDEPSEIVVVDDASDDGTARLAVEAGASVVPVDVRQIAAARNLGAASAAGEFLLFVDADTRVDAPILREAVAALRSGAVGGGALVSWEPPVPWWGRVYLWLFMLVWRRLGHAAGCFFFVRRADFDAVGGFDERFYASEEVWLSKALRARGRFVILGRRVLTSPRKVRMSTAAGLFLTSLRILLRGPRGWQRREGLELWYDGRREGR
ncbi:MAG TPA: glycosyltransferase [Phycisphaerales bacterium]|nr:glycosyltransferase [Phycisphaerales bacterium]HMP36948.1 glycosyltransferase [Phycisphaerales bacterium]